MTTENNNPDERMAPIDEVVQIVGLTRHTWLRAIADKQVTAINLGGRAGWQINLGSARAFRDRLIDEGTKA